MLRKSEIRKDYVQEKYVIIAPRRGKRPHPVKKPVQARPSAKDSIFSPQNIDKEKFYFVVGDPKKWDVKVVANKFPAVSTKNPKAYGQQEVVIETPDPKPELHQLPVSHIVKIFEAYGQRTRELSKKAKIEYILTFKNNGGGSGASLLHSHSQIFATDFIPPHLLDKSQKVQEYKIKNGTCVYCDVIKKETRLKKRVVYKDEHIVAFTPYASMYNYECWVMPFHHHDNIGEISYEERHSWSKVLKHIVKKIDQLHLPYNYYLHQVVNDEDQHVYMKIIPRGEIWGGVEIGSGVVINAVDPDDAAAYYRKGAPKSK